MADVDISSDAIAKARTSGYSDDEIAQHLTQQYPDKFGAAQKAGYSSTEILDHLYQQGLPPGAAEALQANPEIHKS